MRLCRPYSLADPMKHWGERVVQEFDARAAIHSNHEWTRMNTNENRLGDRAQSPACAVSAPGVMPLFSDGVLTRIGSCQFGCIRGFHCTASAQAARSQAPIPLQFAGANG